MKGGYLSFCVLLLAALSDASSSKGSKRVVCYYTDWSSYRPGSGRFLPENIDPSLCTNALYSFAIVNSTDHTIIPSDPWLSIDNKFYERFVNQCKSNANCKPSIALGGWNDSGSNKYSIIFNDAEKRKIFVDSVVDFLKKYGFEGLDMDYEYPSCPQGNCTAGNPCDLVGYQLLMEELREEFDKHGWVMSAAISAGTLQILSSYQVYKLSKVLDWVGVMTYDYHSRSSNTTGPLSPLDHYSDGSTVESIKFLKSLGAAKEKMVVGVPFYATTYLLSSSSHAFGAPSSGAGSPGPYTGSAGSLAYYEICQLVTQGWTLKENKHLGAYAYNSSEWASLNSISDIYNKASLVKKWNLGGLMLWEKSYDDFTGTFCNNGTYPLLKAMNMYLH